MHTTGRGRGTSQQVAGGGVVVVVVYSIHHILLIRNILKQNPLWKFVGETLEPGEPLFNALVGGLREEAGLLLPAVWTGKIVTSVGNDDIVVKEVRPRVLLETMKPHWQYFYKVRLPDDQLLALSGKILDADVDEKFETKAFDLLVPEHMRDFLPPHKHLFEEFKYS